MRTACGGLVPGTLVQGREGRRAAEKLAAERLAVEKLAVEKLLRKLIRKQSCTPCVMVTDKPGSDGAARTGMGLNVEHRQHKGLNNRAKNAHLPTLRRERIIKRSTSARHHRLKEIEKSIFCQSSVRHLNRSIGALACTRGNTYVCPIPPDQAAIPHPAGHPSLRSRVTTQAPSLPPRLGALFLALCGAATTMA
jgi:hypothetical protein